MQEESPTVSLKQHLVTVPILQYLLKQIFTLGIYSYYWLFTRSRAIGGAKGRSIGILTGLFVLTVAITLTDMLIDLGGIFQFFIAAISILSMYIWNLWMAFEYEKLTERKLAPNLVLKTICILVFGQLYLQYKFNRVNESSPSNAPISNDPIFNVLSIPIFAMMLFSLWYLTFFKNYNVPTATMSPTIVPADRIIIQRFAYSSVQDVQRGDIIVFKYPKNPKIDYIKRVVGLPGDRVLVRDGLAIVNDQNAKSEKLNKSLFAYVWENQAEFYTHKWIGPDHYIQLSPSVSELTSQPVWPTTGTPYIVPENSLFVLGDSRDNSSDSRFWGPVPYDHVKGKAIYTLWNLHWFPKDMEKVMERFFSSVYLEN